MKVLVQGRYEILDKGGGDKVQIENTVKELRKLGVDVEIKPYLGVSPEAYDIVHIFQLDWTPETFLYAKKAKEHNKPIVLSPIHHSVKEVKKFDDQYTFDYRRLSAVLLRNQFHRDTLKNIYRTFFQPKKLRPTLISVFMGLESMHKKTLQYSDVVLVQTKLEAKDLKETFGVNFKWELVQNGVGDQFIKAKNYENPLEFEDYLLCVGRIEPRKNQLNIIEAISDLRKEENLDTKLVFIGAKSPRNHIEYTYYFDRALKKFDWIKHIRTVPYEEIPAYYKYAKVCISASWFETTGLTSLEALYMDTNTVASGDRAKEYLGELASYCQPDDVNSIKEAVKKEYYAPRPHIDEELRSKYTWKKAAEKTLKVYKSLLKK